MWMTQTLPWLLNSGQGCLGLSLQDRLSSRNLSIASVIVHSFSRFTSLSVHFLSLVGHGALGEVSVEGRWDGVSPDPREEPRPGGTASAGVTGGSIRSETHSFSPFRWFGKANSGPNNQTETTWECGMVHAEEDLAPKNSANLMFDFSKFVGF